MGRQPARVLLVGAFGHGISHLRKIHQLEEEAQLVGICDTQRPHGEVAELAAGVPWGSDPAAFAAQLSPDIVVICTPIHTHLDIAETAMRSGADILLEKPPVPQTADFLRLERVVAETGRACQIGFQSFGSDAVERLRDVLGAGQLGAVRGIGIVGAWVRAAAYYQRSRWAGHRVLDGRAVVDGAVTNPFAHATASALRIVGSDRLGDLASVEAELFHANPIEADDTSSVRIRTNAGTTIAVALTLCARDNQEPYIVVHGDAGSATLWYTRDELRIGEQPPRKYARTNLLVDLISHRNGESAELLAPLERTGAFTEVVETIRLTEPRQIEDKYQDIIGSGPEQHRIVRGIESLLDRASGELKLFSELDAPWLNG